MSETNWGPGELPPPPKKKVPTWLWFCGGGCLLALILGIIAVVWVMAFVKDSRNPEKQWPKVAQVLPYDERPTDMTLEWGSQFGVEAYAFNDARGFVEVLFRFDRAKAGEVQEKLMNPDEEGGIFGAGARRNLKMGTISVQGRELKILRFDQMKAKDGGNEDVKVGEGPTALVDLTQEGGAPTIIQITRTTGKDPITDEDVLGILKPFHVGPVR